MNEAKTHENNEWDKSSQSDNLILYQYYIPFKIFYIHFLVQL